MVPSHLQQGEATELWRAGLNRELQQGGLDLAKHLKWDYPPPEEAVARRGEACRDVRVTRGRNVVFSRMRNVAIRCDLMKVTLVEEQSRTLATQHWFDMENTQLHSQESTASDCEVFFPWGKPSSLRFFSNSLPVQVHSLQVTLKLNLL